MTDKEKNLRTEDENEVNKILQEWPERKKILLYRLLYTADNCRIDGAKQRYDDLIKKDTKE